MHLRALWFLCLCSFVNSATLSLLEPFSGKKQAATHVESGSHQLGAMPAGGGGGVGCYAKPCLVACFPQCASYCPEKDGGRSLIVREAKWVETGDLEAELENVAPHISVGME